MDQFRASERHGICLDDVLRKLPHQQSVMFSLDFEEEENDDSMMLLERLSRSAVKEMKTGLPKIHGRGVLHFNIPEES